MISNNKILCPKCGAENDNSIKTCKTCNNILKLNDRYHLIKILGDNREITYMGIDLSIDKDSNKNSIVVIKELKVNLLEEWKDQELFTREISTLKTLSHDKIPKLIDDFNTENNHYLVMEFIDGTNLKIESENRSYTESEVLDILKEILNILKYLHTLEPPIIHRDIKLSNIMRRASDNSLTLIDFGSVKDILKVKGGSTIVGSYGFMAPEQFMGKAYTQSDYYSLGAIALILLSKKVPDSIISDEFISSLDISNQMKALISRATKIKLEQRIKTYTQFFNLIDNFNNLEFTFEKKESFKVKKRDNTRQSSEFLDFKERYIKTKQIISSIKLKKDDGKEIDMSIIYSIAAIISLSLTIWIAVEVDIMISIGVAIFFIVISYIFATKKRKPKDILNNDSKSETNFWNQLKDIDDKELLLLATNENIEDDDHRNNIINTIYSHCEIDRGKMIIYKNLFREYKDE